jgi:hypothetical protein
MKKKIFVFSLMLLVVFLFPLSATATKPGNDTNPNGFPPGTHFNLNIHGKKASFTCPAPEYYLRVTVDGNNDGDLGNLVKVCDLEDTCVQTDTQAFGGSMFIPESGSRVTVYVESGKKGPKSAPATTVLEVTDWCSGFGDDTAVRFRLPANEDGYDVYARILAKPTDNPSMTFIDPGLSYAEDETEIEGEMVLIGRLYNGSFETPSEGFTFIRSKGKSTAQDITGLFTWTGYVYYNTDPGSATPTDFCAIDTNANGIIDAGDEAYLKEADVPCEEGYTQVTLYGVYHDSEWVFNIADFVEMFYGIDNKDSKLVQVRFYPR